MELKKLIILIKKNFILLIIIPATIMLSALIYNNTGKTDYKAMLPITISQTATEQTEDYKYDNYYTFRSIDLFTESIEKWFRNPNIVRRTFEKADLEPRRELKDNTKLFKARKLSSNYLEIEYVTDSRENGQKIAKNLIEVLNEEIDKQKKDKETWYKVNASSPYIQINKISNIIISVISLVCGFIITITYILIKHYLKS